MDDFEQHLPLINELIDKKINHLKEDASFSAGTKGDKGDKGDRGESGKSPNVKKIMEVLLQHVQDIIPKIDDIVAIVMSHIRQPQDGEPGPEGPVSTVPGPEGKPGKKGKDGSPDTAEQIVAKINAGEAQIDADRIKNLFKNNKDISSKTYSLSEMDDVQISNPSDGDVLTFSAALNAWVPAPASSGTFISNETPAGLINDVNTIFTLAHAPVAGSLALYLNGARQQPAGGDYTIAGNTITFNFAPMTGSIMVADYRY